MPLHFALIDGAGLATSFIDYQLEPNEEDVPTGAIVLTDDQRQEWRDNPLTRAWVGGVLVTVAPPAPALRYVSLDIVRDRVTVVGKWSAFADALDMLPADKRWHLLTLKEGVASDDADAIALLTAIGCDPVSVLAP